MAQSLEKAFLQKVAQMPQEEEEIPSPVPRVKPGKIKKGQRSSKNKLRKYRMTLNKVS